MSGEEWTTLEWAPPSDDHEVLVNGVPREPDEDERRARRRDEKWRRRGYVR